MQQALSYNKNDFIYQFVFLVKCFMNDINHSSTITITSFDNQENNMKKSSFTRSNETQLWIRVDQRSELYTLHPIRNISLVRNNKEIVFGRKQHFHQFKDILKYLQKKGFYFKIVYHHALCAKIDFLITPEHKKYKWDVILEEGKRWYEMIVEHFDELNKTKQYILLSRESTV